MKNINEMKRRIKHQLGDVKTDKMIELIKGMHCEPDIESYYQIIDYNEREEFCLGISKKQMADEYGITERAVFNMISALDPKRRGNAEPYMIAGQPINLDISDIRIDNKRLQALDKKNKIPVREDVDQKERRRIADRHARFCTKRSMHPVFLQLNVTQLGVLIRSLAGDYCENSSDVTLGLGAYVISQLSKYAMGRLNIFEKQNDNVRMFLEAVDEIDDDTIKRAFVTEDEYIKNVSRDGLKVVGIDELTMFMKNAWKCNIRLVINREIKEYNNCIIEYDNGYFIRDNNTNKVYITIENVDKIAKVD